MNARAWVGVWLSVLLGALQIGNVHVHVCLDGFESQQTLHWGDADLRDVQLHGVASHRDLDLCVQPQALIRDAHAPVPPPLFALLVSLWAATPLRFARTVFRRYRPLFRRTYRLVPPAQAPPC